MLGNLRDSLKNMSQGNLEIYIKRAININDTIPGYLHHNIIHSRNILEFLVKEEQENLSKVHPRLIYSLVQKIIKDSKKSVG